MHQEEIYMITYERNLQKLRGINKKYIFYGKFQKGIYINIFIAFIYNFYLLITFL